MTKYPTSIAHAAESVYERVFNAVEALATSKGDIHDRLHVAAAILLPLRVADFPPHLSSRFESAMQRMTEREPVADEGRLKSTISNLDEETCISIAKEVTSILREVQAIRA